MLSVLGSSRISYYTSKREVVYISLLMCENAPQEWLNVTAENIRRFQKSARYKKADSKDAALEKFKLTFQKQRLWNEVLKIEKSSDAQLGRSFEFSLPKEWSRQEQIDYTTEYTLLSGVCASCGASFSVSRKNCQTENVSSLCSVKGATLPCDACASIPCGLAVRKQHEMLFAASKFED